MMTFAQLCTTAGTHRDWLAQLVDGCAVRGSGYEIPRCRLPRGCHPPEVAVGLCRREGGYLLYWRPAVHYRGDSRVLAALFARSVWRFDSISQLSARLSSLSAEAVFHTDPCPPLTRPEPPAPAPSAPARSASLFEQLRQELGQRVLGQERAVEATAFRLYAHVGKLAPQRPLSLMLHGPTGVGKSELGKAIAPALERCTGQPYRLVWTELNTFTQPHSVHRLTGAPPGYVGYEDAPILESVREQPLSVFMFDELDKAHPDVLKVFLSILDEGRCTARKAGTDGSRELDFRRCVFVFTTNADLSRQGGRPMGFAAPPPPAAPPSPPDGPARELTRRLFEENETARLALVRQGVLKEIAGRFTGLIGFQPLDGWARLAITVKQVGALAREYGVQVAHIDPDTLQALTPEGDALSIRSQVGVLEGLLTPLLMQAARSPGLSFRLTGPVGGLALLPTRTAAAP